MVSNTKIDKIYISTPVNDIEIEDQDTKNSKRPSWIKAKVDTKAIFIKVISNDEAFWYRRYFEDYFFPLEKSSEDYKNYYNHIANEYENFTPQNKNISEKIVEFLKKYNISFNSGILDLGSGTGIVAQNLVKNGFKNVSLLDISEEELKIALTKKELAERPSFVIDLTKEQIPYMYDHIVESMSLDYFKGEQLSLILDKIYTSLNHKGFFIMVDRHLNPLLNQFFKEIESGEINLETPSGNFDYFYYIGQKD